MALPFKLKTSGQHGAGFCNTIAISKHATPKLLVGSDVGACFRSDNGAVNWLACDTGYSTRGHKEVGSVEFAPITADFCVAGTGGGMLVSYDSGNTWAWKSSTVALDGQNQTGAQGMYQSQPRAVGKNIVIDESALPVRRIYAGTNGNGVFRTTDDFTTATKLGSLNGTTYVVRGMANDVNTPTTLYVGCFNTRNSSNASTGAGGLWCIKNAHTGTGNTAVKISSGFNNVEEIWVTNSAAGNGTRIYVAGSIANYNGGAFANHDNGFWRGDLPAGADPAVASNWNWTRLGMSVLPRGQTATDNQITACSIDGVTKTVSGVKTDTLVVGYNRAQTQNIWVSTDNGSSWDCKTNADNNINTTVYGTTKQWWLITGGGTGGASWQLDGIQYCASQLRFDPNNTNIIYSSGRSGVWKTTDNGANWYPAVNGLMVTSNRNMRANPNTDGQAFLNNIDWHLFHYTNHGEDCETVGNSAGANNSFYTDFDESTTPAKVIIGSGENMDNIQGTVGQNPGPNYLSTSAWTTSTLPSNGRALALAADNVAGSTWIVAAVDQVGICQKKGSGAWVIRNSTAMSVNTERAGVRRAEAAWAKGTVYVYILDKKSGLWGSSDSGDSWRKIWGTGGTGNIAWPTFDQESEGYMTVSNNGLTVYLTLGDSVWKLTNTGSGTVGNGVTATRISSSLAEYSFGPLDINPADGHLYVSQMASQASVTSAYRPTKLWQFVIATSQWNDVTTPDYASACAYINSLSFGKDGWGYISCQGQGSYILQPTGGVVDPPPEPDPTSYVVYSGDMSGTNIKYRSSIVSPPIGGWNQSNVAGLKGRIGYASNTGGGISKPVWDGMHLEVAVAVQDGPPNTGGVTHQGVGVSTAVSSEVAVGYSQYGGISGIAQGTSSQTAVGRLIRPPVGSTGGWIKSNIVAARDEAISLYGDASIRLTSDGTSNNHYIKSPDINVVSSTAYVATVWVYNPGTAPGYYDPWSVAGMTLIEKDATLVELTRKEVNLATNRTTNGWVRLTIPVTTNASTAKIEIRLFVYDIGTVYFDGLSLT